MIKGYDFFGLFFAQPEIELRVMSYIVT